MTDSGPTAALPPVPQPLDPNRPVRGLAEWLNFLGFQLMGCSATREAMLARVCIAGYALDVRAEAVKDDLAELEKERRMACDAKRRTELEEAIRRRRMERPSYGTVETELSASIAELGPQYESLVRNLVKLTEDLTPYVEGIHSHLSALPNEDAAKWESKLHRLLIEVRTLLLIDVKGYKSVTNADRFRTKTQEVQAQFTALCRAFDSMSKDLRSVALPTDKTKGVGERATPQTPPGAHSEHAQSITGDVVAPIINVINSPKAIVNTGDLSATTAGRALGQQEPAPKGKAACVKQFCKKYWRVILGVAIEVIKWLRGG